MAVDIITKHSPNPGNEPSNLERGELAINVAEGTLWYGDENGASQVLIQSVTVGGGPPSQFQNNPRTGAIHFDTSTDEMSVYIGGTWAKVGLPQSGSNASHPFKITDSSGTVYLSTEDSLNDDQGAGVGGIGNPVFRAV